MSEPTRDDFDAAIAVILEAYRADRERLRRLEALVDEMECTCPGFREGDCRTCRMRAVLRVEA